MYKVIISADEFITYTIIFSHVHIIYKERDQDSNFHFSWASPSVTQ